MGFARLGPHVLHKTADAMRWTRQANIVKGALDGLDAFESAPTGAITICRPTHDDDLSWDGVEAANKVLRDLAGRRPDYVEVWNEGEKFAQSQNTGNPGGGPYSFAERITQMQRATDVLHGAGLRVAGFSFGVGWPGAGFSGDSPDWQYIAERGFCGVDAIAVHEYWGNNGFTRGAALRHRQLHDITGGNHPPVIITECGRDAVEGGASGYVASGVSVQEYFAELQAYDRELANDSSYVIGGTVFTAGGSDGKWDSFDTDPLTSLIVGSGGPPPPPPPGTCPAGYTMVNGVCVRMIPGPLPRPVTSAVIPMLIGGAIAVAAVSLVAIDLAGITADVQIQLPGGRTVRVPLVEIDEGSPIPPGYRRIG